jgi:hypothetical protein
MSCHFTLALDVDDSGSGLSFTGRIKVHYPPAIAPPQKLRSGLHAMLTVKALNPKPGGEFEHRPAVRLFAEESF